MILSLLGLNRLWLYMALAVMAIGAVTTTYYVWKSSIERAALMEFNRAQLEQSRKDQEEFLRRQEALEEQQREATRALLEQNRDVQNRIESIQGNLNSPAAAAADRPASDILKRTVEQLRAIR
jgi:Tfp pilus assembly protein PilE